MNNPISIDMVVRQRQAEMEAFSRNQEMMREAKDARNNGFTGYGVVKRANLLRQMITLLISASGRLFG